MTRLGVTAWRPCLVRAALAWFVLASPCEAADAQFEGVGVPVISGIAMGCQSPYALTRDCSLFSGATRQIPSLSKEFRVAGSADGTVVFVMNGRLFSGESSAEHDAAVAVRDIAAALDAHLVKVEAVSAGSRIMGYVLSFDRAVYDQLLSHPGVPARQRPATQALVPAGSEPCELAEPPAAAPGDLGSGASPSVPTSRRYVMVVRDSGAVNLMRVGTLAFGNVVVRAARANDVLDCLRRAVQSVLSPARGFEITTPPVRLPFVLPPFYVNQYDGFTSAGSTAQSRQQTADLLSELARITQADQAGYAVVLNDWGSFDAIERTNQPVVGYGVYLREFAGAHEVYAYAAVQISVYEAASGKLNSWAVLGHRKLDSRRWIELREGQVLSDETLAGFLPDVRAALPLREVPEVLCQLKLLPILVQAPRFSLQSSCALSYPSK